MSRKMNVFVTGGTGVLGKPVVGLLTGRGHTVTGLAHSDASETTLRDLGAESVRSDLFDPGALTQMTQGMDAVLHLATRIPPMQKMRSAVAWAENDRIRAEGTRNLVDAAITNKVEVLVYPSVTFFYPDSGERWIDASSAGIEPTYFLKSTLKAEAEVERFASSGGRGVTLRLGWLYGPASGHTRETLQYARRGIAALAGTDAAFYSSIWSDDAALAIVLAMERASSGVYDVVDDEPLPQGELTRAMASAVGRNRLRRLPRFVTRLVSGKVLSGMAGRSQRVSNTRFKQATGWDPATPSAREGWLQLTR